jgi:excisionase family DNA binding protein
MSALLLPEAAAVLGVSVDTVRRKIRKGQLTAAHDTEGRVLVEVPPAMHPAGQPPADAMQAAVQAAEAAWQAPSSPPEPAQQVPSTDALLLEEVRRQRDQLADQVAALRERLNFAERSIQAHQQGEAELRRLLAAALQQRALAAPSENRSEAKSAEPSPWWARWWPWRR